MLARALVIAFLFASPLEAQCEVTGVASLDRIRVRMPASQPIRTLAVSEVPIAVRPARNGLYRDVRVLGPLAFEGRSDGVVPWTIRRAGTVADGAVWLTPLVEIEEVVERERGELSLRVQVADEVWISRLRVPCAALSLGRGEDRPGDPAGFSASSGPLWQPQSDRVWLMSRRGDGASVRVDAPNGLPSPFVETERRGPWLHVVTSFSSGAALRGWVRESELRMAEPAAQEPRAFVRTLAPAPRACPRRPRFAGEQLREATIAAGTAVSTHPDGTPWASFPEATTVTVSVRASSSWARVVSVRGIFSDGSCAEVLTRAWIPASALGP